MNAFDNTGDSRATVLVFQPGTMVRLGGGVWEGVVPTLRAEAKRGDNEPHILILDGTRVDDVRVYDDGLTPCLKNRMGTGGNNVPFVAQEVEMDEAIPIQGTIIGCADHNGPAGKGFGVEGDPMYTLDSVSQHGVGQPIGFSHTQGLDAQPSDVAFPTLRKKGSGHAVAYDEYNDSIADVHHALRAGTRQSTGVLEGGMVVRRLTPLECERLMGWPDNHTQQGVNGEVSDTNRYKMCGNGVASPVAQWIGEQLMNVCRDLD